MRSILFSFVLLTAVFAQATTQSLTCRGQLRDDNGFPDGEIAIGIKIENPNVLSLKRVHSRADAEKRVKVSGLSGYGENVTSLSFNDENQMVIGGFNAAFSFSVFVPEDAIGQKGRISKRVYVNEYTGGGTYTASLGCTSTVE